MQKRNKQLGNKKNLPNPDSFENQDVPNSGRRSVEDQHRDESVYKYLLECLTDLGIEEGNNKPNESSIANQWGQKNNRIFIRRVLRSVLPEYYDENERASVATVPGLTPGKLVEILVALEDYWVKKRQETPDKQVPRILTSKEKLRAFHKYYELTPEEKNKLGISIHPGETLLKELLESLTDIVKGLKYENIKHFYKEAINIYHYLKETELKNKLQSHQSPHVDIIKLQIQNLLEEHYQGINENLKIQKIENLVKKVKREINRIELQCGLRQVKSLLSDEGLINELEPNANSLPQSFIVHLTRSLVENEILTDDFPINLKHIEIEKTQPLPLYVKTQENQNGLLNALLADEYKEDIDGLQKLFTYQIKVHFYVKPPKNYQPRFSGEKYQTSSKKLEFFEEVTGVGSPIYNIVAAINRFLLSDVQELSDYLPVARNIVTNNNFFGSPSLVWSYTLVNLCRKEDIEKAIQNKKNYDDIVSGYEPVDGEYCGFDVVEVVAKAALHARLRAIKQTGINPDVYLTQVCHRIEELNAFREAERYLSFYPFSLKAMECSLNQTIFKDRYRTHDHEFNFTEINPGKYWSSVAYDAHLNITEAYLKEGLYRIAKKYLDIIEPHIEDAKKSKNNFLNDLLLAKYELCLFRYHYFTDFEDSESRKLHSDRSSAIRAATDSLSYAEEYLKNFLEKHYIIGESAQSNFHPFFYIFSRIYAHRAKLYIFTSSYTDRPGSRWDGLVEPIRLFEKARIYAAREGNTVHYAYWSSFQSWCYLMLAYLGNSPSSHQEFSRTECIDWAKRLVRSALICYENTGKLCYQQIKDNSGRITNNIIDDKYYEKYGDIQIQVAPLIQELSEDSKYSQKYDSEKNVIYIDFSILKQNISSEHKSIYLFGTHSSILIFAMGMLELCDDEQNENQLEISIQKAIRMFTYCSAIAEEGNYVKRNTSDGTVYLERIFETEDSLDSLVRGLYPHRLTQFADLGKIWAATCKSILHIYNANTDWQDINKLLESLPNSPKTRVLHNVCGQQRYNGHLESHCEKLFQYFEQLQGKKPDYSSLIEIRNKIVRDIFKIMRGESDVRP
jgi:hypothetical protein